MTHIWYKVLAKRDIGHIWDKSSNGTCDFVYSVIIIPKRVVGERLINQRGVWDGSCEVTCENWVRNGKVIRPCLVGLFDPFSPLGEPGTTRVCYQQPENFQVGYNRGQVAARSHCLKINCLDNFWNGKP